MASDETKPLLIKANSSWNRRSNLASRSMSSTTSSGATSNSSHQESVSSDLSNITSVLDKNVSSTWRIRGALVSILLSVVLERAVFYGLTGNFVMFLNLYPLEWKSYHAVNALFLFFGVSFIMSLVGGWISDSLLGHFKTIIISYIIYMCGYILLPFLAVNTNGDTAYGSHNRTNATLPSVCLASEIGTSNATLFRESCSWLIVIILVLIAIAAGMLKANICPFGSDQFVRASQQIQLSFFSWFYWCVNIGSFLGLGIVAYIEQANSFFYGFIACTVALGFSLLVFALGRPFYVSRPPDGSVLTNIFKIICEACRNRRLVKQNHRTSVTRRSHAGIHETQLSEVKIPFLDYAKRQYGGCFHNSLVDDVKKLGMILAVFAVLTPYWIVYFQMQTTFLFQGLNMRLSFSGSAVNTTDQSDNPVIAVAWFTLCDAIFVIILLPLFDRIIYPRMARAGYSFTFAKRIVLGMLFAAAAMVAAGVVEHYRLQSLEPDYNNTCLRTYIPQRIGKTVYNASTMSVLWQIPQYTFIGISEVFASVASLQFAVMVAPKSMKAAITGLFYFFSGIGSFMGIAIVSVLTASDLWFHTENLGNLNCWYPCGSRHKQKLKECHFDQYFYFLAGLEGLGIVLFIVVAWVYKLNVDELTFHSRTRSETSSESSRHVQKQGSCNPSPATTQASH